MFNFTIIGNEKKYTLTNIFKIKFKANPTKQYEAKIKILNSPY